MLIFCLVHRRERFIYVLMTNVCMRRSVGLLVVLVFLAACQGTGEGPLELQSPFIGGSTGLGIAFQDLRKEVFDGGRDPFDVVVRLENKGESPIRKEDVRVRLTGVNPAEFSKLEENLVKSPDDDVLESRKDAEGNVLLAPPAFVEFEGLNRFAPIAGASVAFPLRAEVCYKYQSNAVSKLCVLSNVLNPAPESICRVDEDKPVFSSGAPLQVVNAKESARAKDKVGFSFEVRQAGTGQVFERGSKCDRTLRKNENRVYVTVDSRMSGLSCTGLESSGSKAQGFVTLFDGVKLVTCTQPISTKSDFEQLVGISAEYDYEEFVQTELVVKSSGESS